MTVSSFFPTPDPNYAVPQAAEIVWEKNTGGAAMAIDLDTVKNFLNIPLEDTAFDAEKSMFLVQAQAAVEKYCQLSIRTTEWVGYAPRFFNQMRIDRRPFNSVVKIEYVAPDTGEILTLDPSVYLTAKALRKMGTVQLGSGQLWPDVAVRPDAVRITVSAGWAKADVPDELVSAILMTIAALDKARADDGGNSGGARTVYALKHMQAAHIVPDTARAMIAHLRLLRFGVA